MLEFRKKGSNSRKPQYRERCLNSTERLSKLRKTVMSGDCVGVV